MTRDEFERLIKDIYFYANKSGVYSETNVPRSDAAASKTLEYVENVMAEFDKLTAQLKVSANRNETLTDHINEASAEIAGLRETISIIEKEITRWRYIE